MVLAGSVLSLRLAGSYKMCAYNHMLDYILFMYFPINNMSEFWQILKKVSWRHVLCFLRFFVYLASINQRTNYINFVFLFSVFLMIWHLWLNWPGRDSPSQGLILRDSRAGPGAHVSHVNHPIPRLQLQPTPYWTLTQQASVSYALRQVPGN